MKCHAMTKARRTISGILTKTFNVDLIIRKQPDKTAEHLALQLAWILQKCQRVKQPPPPSFTPQKRLWNCCRLKTEDKWQPNKT